VRSRQPGSGGSAGPIRGEEQPIVFRWLRRLSLRCFEHRHGDIRDAREATATHPLIVRAVGEQEAREIAYRSYAPVIDPELTGNFAEDALIDAMYRKERR
jgi:hypothetical protein